jgi:undecaprenyl diphosphate synthase
VSQPSEVWPRHVAIIMDGNGRWARQRHRPRVAGHRAGIKSAQAAMDVCRELAIPFLTLYTFSIENWQRPQAEVDELMRLLSRYLRKEAPRLHENQIRFLPIGQLDRLPPGVRDQVREMRAATAGHRRLTLSLALSYGGRTEIVDAVNAVARDRAARGAGPGPLGAAELEAHLYAPEVPPPDLMIRTSGEMRLSNFLLWEAARASLLFLPVLWPDFTAAGMRAAIRGARERRAAAAGARA